MTCPDCQRWKDEATRLSTLGKAIQTRARELRAELDRIKAHPLFKVLFP